MRWKEINEAPLADFGAYGDMSTPGSLRADDLKAINNPKWLEKVRSSLAKLPYNLNIYMVNAKDGIVTFDDNGIEGYSKFDVRDLGNIQKYVGVHNSRMALRLTGQIPKDFKSSITVIMVENEGTGRIPLTPWMMSHRVAHAMLYAGYYSTSLDSDSRNQVAVNKFTRAMTDFMRGVESRFLNSEFHREAARRLDPEIGILIARMTGTMKSAKTGNLTASGEFQPELIAQYIIQGSVTLHAPALDVQGRSKPFVVDPKFQKYFDLADGLVHRWEDGETFAREAMKAVQPPREYWAAFKDGQVMANVSTEARAKEYQAKGYEIEHVPVSRQAMTAYNKKIAAQKELADAFDTWKQEGRLSMGRGRTATDRFDDFIAESQKKINEAIKGILDACVGKVLVI